MIIISVMTTALTVSMMESPAQAGGIYQIAAQDAPQVELYITDWCPYCRKAIEFFNARGIRITVYDIEKDQAAAVRKNELDNRRGVPFAIINGTKVHGYSEAAYLKALQQK